MMRMADTTRFSDYDKHGNARRIDAPNGVSTELAFSVRGKLLSKTMRSAGLLATTTYQYDDAGNMKKITMPDNSIIEYTYDAAHRLTAVADSRGNRIDYVLDLTGNRVSEAVRDPSGTLARQVSRTFDTMGRMTSQTGAAQ
jgi:YD repeat-containing protein